MTSAVPALMRVVRYTNQFKVLKDYTTYQLTVPAQRPKNYKKGSGTRIWCDGMAIGAMLVCEPYTEDIRHTRSNVHMYRTPIKGGCLVIMPAHMYRLQDIEALMNRERVWHKEYGWIQVEQVRTDA